jgi:hypothetical protein
MKKPSLILLLLIFPITTAACHRMASTSSVDQSRFTPDPTSETYEVTTPFPGPAADEWALDATTEQTLSVYPLWVGSSWVYDYLGYDESREVIWRVVETVIGTDFVDGYYVAELERTAELVEGYAPEGFPCIPETGTFWYLIDGGELYRYEHDVDADLTRAWLDLMIPFPKDGEVWYPDPDQRANDTGEVSGSRSASAPFRNVLPMGGTYTCYSIVTQYEDRLEKGIFCETVGFVYQELTHYDPVYGYRLELEGYSLQ